MLNREEERAIRDKVVLWDAFADEEFWNLKGEDLRLHSPEDVMKIAGLSEEHFQFIMRRYRCIFSDYEFAKSLYDPMLAFILKRGREELLKDFNSPEGRRDAEAKARTSEAMKKAWVQRKKAKGAK
jgi:hypothetical protein